MKSRHANAKGFLLLLLVVSFSLAYAQSPRDSLRSLLSKEKTSEQADLLNKIADSYIPAAPDSVKVYSLRAEELSQAIGYTKGLAESHFNLAFYHNQKGNWDKAIQLLQTASSEYEKVKDYFQSQRCLYIVGTQLREKGKQLNALEVALKTLKGLKDHPNIKLQGHLQNLIAVLMKEQGNYPAAISYYKEAFYSLSKDGSSNYRYAPIENIGILFLDQNKPDSALYYFNKAYNGNKLNNNNISLISTLTNMALAYAQLNNLTKAFGQLKEAETINQENALLQNTILIKLAYCEVYLKKKEYLRALQEAEAVDQLLAPTEKHNRKKILNYKYQAYLALADYRNALINQTRYMQLKDSINDAENKNRISELQARYEFEQKELQIVTLREEATAKSSLVNIVILLAVALLAALILYIWARKQKQDKAERVYRAQIQEAEIKALRSQINPHFIYNCLNSINNFVLRQDAIKASQYLTKFAKLMRLTLENSRTTYVPLEREIEMLTLYIELEQFRVNYAFSYSLTLDETISKSAKIPSMILQPFVENAIHHGLFHKQAPGVLTITFHDNENYLECMIEDDGIGRQKSREIRKSGDSEKQSFGIEISRERLIYLGKRSDKGANRVDPIEILDLKDDMGNATGTKCILRIPIDQ